MDDKMDKTLVRTAHKCIDIAVERDITVDPYRAATLGVLVGLDVPLFRDPRGYVKHIAENTWDGALWIGLKLSDDECTDIVEGVIEGIQEELEESEAETED